MPYKSQAQRRKFHAMKGRGEISGKTVAKYDSASKGKKLPEKVKAHKRSGRPETGTPGTIFIPTKPSEAKMTHVMPRIVKTGTTPDARPRIKKASADAVPEVFTSKPKGGANNPSTETRVKPAQYYRPPNIR